MGDNAKSMFEFLSSEGFRSHYDEDGDIAFKYEGDTYLVIFHDNKPDFASLTKVVGLEIEEDDTLAIYKLINQVNVQYILGKVTLREGDDPVMIFKVDFLGPIEQFQEHLARYLTIIQQMEKDFVAGYSEL